ncbi:hypothetical protein [Rhodococcus jostii]|uniref:hypothetical protein n=1 Tax=Rhodococcus jostii TaxID=132919 RepID=UPI003662E6BA
MTPASDRISVFARAVIGRVSMIGGSFLPLAPVTIVNRRTVTNGDGAPGQRRTDSCDDPRRDATTASYATTTPI